MSHCFIYSACSAYPTMDVLAPVLAAAGRLVGHDAKEYCNQFNVTYEHRVDDPGALPEPSALRT